MYGGDPEQACDRAVKNWYQEAKNYDFRSPHLDDSTSECIEQHLTEYLSNCMMLEIAYLASVVHFVVFFVVSIV